MFKKIFILITFSFIFFLSSCSDVSLAVDPVKVPQNMQILNDSAISWENPGRSDISYTISVYDNSGNTILPKVENHRGNSISINNSISNLNGFIVEIQAFAVDVKNNTIIMDTATETKRFSFTRLAKVTNLRVNLDGKLSWDATNGANGYVLQINDIFQPVLTSNSFDLKDPGLKSLRVYPVVVDANKIINRSYYSTWSDLLSTNILQEPKNIDYNSFTNLISWSGVSDAKEYKVIINGVENQITNKNEALYNSNNKSFSLRIVAIGDGVKTINSQNLSATDFDFISTVEKIEVNNGILEWPQPSGANSYKIKINGLIVEEFLSSNKYDKIPENKSVDIEVLPFNKDKKTFSSWSAPKSITLLSTPKPQWDDNVRLSGESANPVFWDGITNASGYSVRVTYENENPVIRNFSSSERLYGESFAKIGLYKIEVKSLAGESGSIFDSRYSKPILVRRLSSVTKTNNNFVTSNQDNLEQGFTVNFNKDQYAFEYQLFKSDSLVTGANTKLNQFVVSNVVDNNSFAARTINYRIQSIGQTIKNDEGIFVTLDSLLEDSLSFDIRVLQTPSNLNFSGEDLKWNSVNNSAGYTLKLSGQNRTVNTNLIKLDFVETGIFKLNLISRGNGGDVLPSNPTQELTIERISAPTELKINTELTNDGTLTWSNVPFSQSYVAYIDGNSEPVNINRQTDMYQYIKNSNTSIYIVAIANYYKDDRATSNYYYLSSRPSATITVLRLNSPEFPNISFENGLLKWNTPTNLNQGSAITYTLYNRSKSIIASGLSGNSYDLSSLEGGNEYTFYIRAIGDGVKNINSDFSPPKSIFKLGSPNVKLVNGGYEWQQVVMANEYVVYVDGIKSSRTIRQFSSTYRFEPYFDQIKTYKIEVIAIGDKGVKTIDSNPYTFNQTTSKLPTPDFNVTYSSEFYTPESTININILNPNQYAKEYAYYLADASPRNDSSSRVQLRPTSEGKISIKVGMIGGVFDENGIYYIDSTIRSYSQDFVILQKPSASQVEITIDGRITWPVVPDRIRYEYQIAYDDSAFSLSQRISESFVEIDLKDVKETIKIRIRATGNNINIFGSDWTEKTFQKPTP